jgi:hypothetical protein
MTAITTDDGVGPAHRDGPCPGLPNKLVHAANGLGYAYRDTGSEGGVPLVLLQHFRGNPWYRHATQHNKARIRAGGIEADVTLHLVGDPALNARVTAAYRAKYGNQPSLAALFFKAPATEATLRLDN